MIRTSVGWVALPTLALALLTGACQLPGAEPAGPPTYALVTLRHDETRIQMVAIMQTGSEAQCDVAIRAYMAGFQEDPSSVEWRQTERSCTKTLENIYQRVMNKEKFHATYIAFSPKGAWEYESRIVLFGIPSTQAQEVCQQVAREIGNTYHVQAECIQGTIG